MTDVHTPETVKAQMQADIDAANVKTGRTDATVHDAINTLIAGYGQGGGGGVPNRTAWYRPPDMPDITSLPFNTEPYKWMGYYTVDKMLPYAANTITAHVVGNGRSHIELCDMIDGELVPRDSHLNLATEEVTIDLTKATTRFPVIRMRCDNRRALFDENVPIIECSLVRWENYYLCYSGLPIYVTYITAGSHGEVFTSSGLGGRGFGGALQYVDFSKHTDVVVEGRSLYNIFNGQAGLKVIKFPDVEKNSVVLDGGSQSSWPDNAFSGCMSLSELDLSIFDTSEVVRLTNVFDGCKNLRKLNISGWNLSACTGMSKTFTGCAALVDLITDGTIMPSVSFSLSDSTLLSVDSLNGVIAALPALADGATATLTLGSVNVAKLTADELVVATEKGWTIA